MTAQWTRLLLVGSMALFLVLRETPAQTAVTGGQKVELTLAFSATADPTDRMLFLKPWAQRFPILSRGRLSIRFQEWTDPGTGSLFDLLATGKADIVWAPISTDPGRFPLLEVFELPFMAWPAEAGSQALMAFHRTRGAAAGPHPHVLLVHADAPAWLHAAGAPIRRVEDFAGRRIYAPTRAMRGFVEGLGGTAATSPKNVGAALAHGQLDGALMSFKSATATGVVQASRFHVQPGPLAGDDPDRAPGLFTIVYVLAMSAQVYAALPDDLRRLLDTNASQAFAEQAGRTWDSVDYLDERNARGEGHVFYSLAGRELQAWAQAGRQVADRWVEAITRRGHDGRALLREARELLARHAVVLGERREARTKPGRGKGG